MNIKDDINFIVATVCRFCVHIYIYMYLYMYMCAYINIYICIYIYIYQWFSFYILSMEYVTWLSETSLRYLLNDISPYCFINNPGHLVYDDGNHFRAKWNPQI